MGIGFEIQRVRRAKGLTQVELAKRVGIEQGSLSDIENEKSLPRQSTLRLIALELGDDLKEPELTAYLATQGRSPARNLVEDVVLAVDGNVAVLEIFVARLAARLPDFEKMLDKKLTPEIYRRAASHMTLVDALVGQVPVNVEDFAEAAERVFFDDIEDELAEGAQQLGSIDEFDLDASLTRHNDMMDVLTEWYEHEGKVLPTDFLGVLPDEGWKMMTLQERKGAIQDVKKLIDRRLEETEQ